MKCYIIAAKDTCQCHIPGDQNRAEDCYEEESYSRDEEGQFISIAYFLLSGGQQALIF